MNPAAALLARFAELGAVDTSFHIGQWPFRLRAQASATDAAAYADRHGLSALWVSHLAALFGFATRSANEECLTACHDDGRLVPFAVLDASAATWREELKWAFGAGARGIRLAPSAHGYRLADAVALARRSVAAGLVLQVLVRLDDARVRHPRWAVADPQPHEIAEFIAAIGDVPIVLSGMRADEWDEVVRHLGGAAPASVHLDLWHVNGPFTILDELAAEPDRWVFGSGFPVQTPEATMLQIMASEMSDAARAAFSARTAQALLGR